MLLVLDQLKNRFCQRYRLFKKTTTAMATGTSLNKRFNEQHNGCVSAFNSRYISQLLASAKQQREMIKFYVVWRT